MTRDQFILISFTLDIIGSWANTMLKKNYTEVTEFILLGLTDRADLQPVLSVVFLVIYLITVIGNVGMVLLIRSDSKFQTPVYFFLSHLSFVDLCYATSVTPQMLVSLSSEKKTISFLGCFIQFDFSIFLGSTGCYMLTVMAYDRYVAICKPLLYASKMSWGVSISLVAAPYIYGFANGLTQAILMLHLSFCGPNEINHVYCVDPPLLVLPALILMSQRLPCSWGLVPTSRVLSASSSSPTFSSLESFYISTLQKGGPKTSPPVVLTWQLSLYFMGHASACFWGPLQRYLWNRAKL